MCKAKATVYVALTLQKIHPTSINLATFARAAEYTYIFITNENQLRPVPTISSTEKGLEPKLTTP